MKVAIIFIGTSKYLDFLPAYYESAEEKLFPGVEKHFFVFTDGSIDDIPENVTYVPQEHLPFPDITLFRFDIIKKAIDHIEECDYLLFLDADTIVVDTIDFDEIFKEKLPLVGVHHPCHKAEMKPHDKFPGAFETSENSTACVKIEDDTSIYWQGCLWGGEMKEVVQLINELSFNIKKDDSNGVMAKWHDESHLNRYFINNKSKVNTLHPSFSFPEMFKDHLDYKPRIIHRAKNNSEYQV